MLFGSAGSLTASDVTGACSQRRQLFAARGVSERGGESAGAVPLRQVAVRTSAPKPVTFASHDETAAHLPGGRERSRRALNASIGSIVLRVSTFITTLGATAIATREFSSTYVATWFILISLAAFQGLVDLGIMARLTTSIAEVRDPIGAGLGATEALYSSAIRGASKLSGSLGLGVGLIVLILALSSGETRASDTQLAVLCFVVISLLAIPFQGPLRLLHGLQNGFAANISLAASYLLVVTSVSLTWVLGGLSFPIFVALTGSPALLGGLLAGIVIRVTTSVRLVSLDDRGSATSVRKMVHLSSPYLVIAISTIVGFSSDQLVLAVLGNSEEVAQYATTYRMFTQVPITVYLALASLWPAAANARVEGDGKWIHQTTARTWRLSILCTGIASIPLLIFGTELISWWTGDTVTVSFGLLGACAMYSVVNAAWSPLHFALLGQGLVGFMARCMALMAAANIVISASLVKPLGASGPVVGSTISLGVMVVLPYMRAYRRAVLSDL